MIAVPPPPPPPSPQARGARAMGDDAKRARRARVEAIVRIKLKDGGDAERKNSRARAIAHRRRSGGRRKCRFEAGRGTGVPCVDSG